jgi:hypothetical protein
VSSSPLAASRSSALGHRLVSLVTYLTTQRFTNMAVVLLHVQATVVFGLGLISEQIAQMRFERTGANLPPRARRQQPSVQRADMAERREEIRSE